MGLDLAAATAIRDVCRARRLTASVNFQLRYSAMMLAVADAIARGQLGELVGIELHLNLVTPWHLFPHLIPNPPLEIVAHSLHSLHPIPAQPAAPNRGFSAPQP